MRSGREFSESGHNDLHGTNILSAWKGNGIMGFWRFQAMFRVYFEFGNVLRTIPYSSPWRGRVEVIWGITWFSGGSVGDHLFPRVYRADYRMWLPLTSNDHKNIAEPCVCVCAWVCVCVCACVWVCVCVCVKCNMICLKYNLIPLIHLTNYQWT